MRGRQVLIWLATLLALSSLAQIGRPVPGHVIAAEPAENLLVNGDFEGNFSFRMDPYNGTVDNELSVADGWELWYNNEQGCPPYLPGCGNPLSFNRRPEYKRVVDPIRVRSGAAAQQWFNTSGTHTAGIYQSITVPAGSWVRFSIWVLTWSSNRDVLAYSFYPGYYGTSIGIDPTGGEDWTSPDIQWSAPVTLPDEWVYLELDAYTESGQVTVWMQGAPLYPVKNNNSFWDDATLVVLDEPPAPTPTPTATYTPAPTPDPTPTGYEPPSCVATRGLYEEGFETGFPPGWGQDAGEGVISTDAGALHLGNGTASAREFPLVWFDEALPEEGDLRISFRYAYNDATGYGVSIGIGSGEYQGQRALAGAWVPGGIEDILQVQKSSASDAYWVKLLGQKVWSGAWDDEAWHQLDLELREHTYVVRIDGVEQGHGVSYWRPRSMHLGNPVIVVDKGIWTEVAIDDLAVGTCLQGMVSLPLVLKAYPKLTATPTATLSPTASITATSTATSTQTATVTATHAASATATSTPTGTDEAQDAAPRAPARRSR